MRGFDVMAGAGNDRNAFSRRCVDSPQRVIDEQHRAVEHDEFGPCRCHMGLGQRRGDVGGVERGCSASWRGRSGNPWTVWRDEPKLRDQALANRSRIRRRDTGCRRTAAAQISRVDELAAMVEEVIAGCTRAVMRKIAAGIPAFAQMEHERIPATLRSQHRATEQFRPFVAQAAAAAA